MNKQEALEFLSRTAKGLAEMFGSSCETLVHDMSRPDHPILAIYNGHVSGRQVGSTVDILGGHNKIEAPGTSGEADTSAGGKLNMALITYDYINMLVTTPEGKKIKSSTFNLVGEDYSLALGINFDFTELAFASSALADFVSVGPDLRSAIALSSDNLLNDIFAECVAAIGKPISAFKKADRLQLIAMLEEKNAFSFQKSVPYVSERLNVSRYTIYKYLNELAEGSAG
ncbi:MAG: transcriptional regulator [Firmicutes bacterium]|nr:transcriptional regulator [Bacillota bacterium]